MRTALTLAASLLLNLAAFAGLDASLRRAQQPPAGEVSIVQLPSRSELPMYAQVESAQAEQDASL